MSWLGDILARLRLRAVRDESRKTRTAVAGEWGEDVAARHLRRGGYTILGRRVRPNRRDELDIIARQGDVLAFVEVKTRKSELYGRPASSVDSRKRHALCRAAVAYLRSRGFPKMVYRMDVVEVVGEKDAGEPVVRHIENAFQFPKRTMFPNV